MDITDGDILEVREWFDSVPVPVEGRLVCIDGVIYDCDTGKVVEC